MNIFRIGNSKFRSMGHLVPGMNQLRVSRRVLFLFNVFINDLFPLVEETEICNYAYDRNSYVCGHELEHIASSLEDTQKLSKWSLDNNMKLNPDKCHLLIFREKTTDLSVQIGATKITESVAEIPPGVTLDKNIHFMTHENTLCKKARQKLHALGRIPNYVDV